MAKHTAGTWRLHRSTIKSASGADVARIVSGWGVREAAEAIANAHLIATAPDLLAACEYAAQFMAHPRTAEELAVIGKRLRSVIDKARGES